MDSQLQASPLDILPRSILESTAKQVGVERCFDLVRFCYLVAIEALENFVDLEYSKLDPFTGTNCCHTISGFGLILFEDISLEEVEGVLRKLRLMWSRLQGPDLRTRNFFYNLARERHGFYLSIKQRGFLIHFPQKLLHLLERKILNYTFSWNEISGHRASVDRIVSLKLGLSTKLAWKIVKQCQLNIARIATSWCQSVAGSLPDNTITSDRPLMEWRKYVGDQFCRTDASGRPFLSNLYSMQCTLAYLKHTKAYIAILRDDWVYPRNLCKRRLECFYYSQGKFSPFTTTELLSIKDRQPIIVFGGSILGSENDCESSWQTVRQKWLPHFDKLALACDLKYPQFPTVGNEFDSSPIIPEEECLQSLLMKLSSTRGVCVDDPRLFCLTHIYLASGREIKAMRMKSSKIDSLPVFPFSSHLRTVATVA